MWYDAFREGQVPSHAIILLDGKVKLCIDSSEGKRFILGLSNSGDILGLAAVFSHSSYQMTAEAYGWCNIASISRLDLLAFIQRHGTALMSVMRELSQQHDQACVRLHTIALTPCVSAKVARLLLELCSRGQRTELGVRIHIPLTHGEIGECIGTSRESVTRALGQLQRRRFIQVRGTILTVTDYPALEDFAGI